MRKTTKSVKSKVPLPLTLSNEYKAQILENAYLGKRGYTVLKSALSKEDEECLKKDLFLKPETPGAVNYGGASEQSTPFLVYRENDKKMYIPRFYGIERYGLPAKSELSPGLDIDVPFEKPLRDYQEQIVTTYLHAVNGPHPSGGILQIYTGGGKTIMALKIISTLAKKTMILVHKKFLMNQWIERIQEFLPSAKIGKIQGKVMDIENKDIVIAMIQTMYNLTFPDEVYGQFGLTVIDEVHRIGSEEFSRTLLKTITPYMLGISATVERKDKLTKLLYMFIGPMIYSTERKKDDIVSVRGIEFRTGDEEFNETETDFRGKPKYSTMISKLCDYGPRRDLIVRVIQDLLKENAEAQMIVLAHNRSLLNALYESIQYRKFATCGYYLGGMKQLDLKESETKQVVLATYAMAAEALDIKNLSILILATPKTDIVQSVGRILRMKHENPIVVDILDSHQLFQNQWAQRKRYYKKCNYRIRHVVSSKYTGFTDPNWEKEWLNVYDPKLGIFADASKVKKDIGKFPNTGEQSSKVDEVEHEVSEPVTIFAGKCCINVEGMF